VLAHVFKVVVDPFIGKVGVFRVHQGTVRKDAQLFVGSAKRAVQGGASVPPAGQGLRRSRRLVPGDIGAVAKVDDIAFDCVLHDSHDEDHIHLRPLQFPQPMQGLAVQTQRKGDEQRLFEVLHKLELEDPCFASSAIPHTNETVIRGLGDMHLRTKLLRACSSSTSWNWTPAARRSPTAKPSRQPPKGTAATRSKAVAPASSARCILRVEPLERGAGFEFVDVVKGGAIPVSSWPRSKKACVQALTEGVVAGFPVQDLRVTVYDGKTHAVDGKEVAFMPPAARPPSTPSQGHPIVLEPMVQYRGAGAGGHIGDLTGDLATKRGHVAGTQPRPRQRSPSVADWCRWPNSTTTRDASNR
jgi:elongation factor G